MGKGCNFFFSFFPHKINIRRNFNIYIKLKCNFNWMVLAWLLFFKWVKSIIIYLIKIVEIFWVREWFNWKIYNICNLNYTWNKRNILIIFIFYSTESNSSGHFYFIYILFGYIKISIFDLLRIYINNIYFI